MIEQSNDETNIDGNESGVSMSDVVSDLVTGTIVPAPIKRNLIKAFSRLCSAAIDLPVAYLEGKSDERRAETQGRIKLINTTANQISEQMRIDPEYAHRAITQFGNKVLREQVNLDMTVAKGMANLRENGELNEHVTAETSETEIDDDWLNNFETEARTKSTEDMQIYFSRVLSGEIQKPNSFSIKTVKLLGNMDKQAANMFRKLCSMCLMLGGVRSEPSDARVAGLDGIPGDNSLSKYGLDFSQLNFLNEYGLIISDYNSWQDYQICIGQTVQSSGNVRHTIRMPFSHQRRSWILIPDSGRTQNSEFRLNGVALTHSGRELIKIVDFEPVEQYTHDLMQFFRNKRLRMTEVEDAVVQVVESDNTH